MAARRVGGRDRSCSSSSSQARSRAAAGSFAQVRLYSAELSDFFTRGVGARHRGVRLPRLADAAARARRTVGVRGAGAASPGSSASRRCSRACSRSDANLPLYEPLWRALPAAPVRARSGAPDADRLPRDRSARRRSPLDVRGPAAPGSPARGAGDALVAVVLAVDLHVPVFGAVAPDRANAAYAAIRRAGTAPRAARCSGRTSISAACIWLRTPVATRAPTGLLDHGAPGRRPPRTGAPRPLVRPRDASARARRAIRRRASRPLPPEPAGSPPGAPTRPRRRCAQQGWRLLGRDGAISTWEAPP